MKITIRMISLATTFFWIFLIAFYVSAVYSVKDILFDFEEPQIDLTSENEILFSLPIKIDNKGYYNIGSFNVTTKIQDKRGFIITQGSTFIPVIEKDTRTKVTHNITIDINNLLQNSQDYLFNDTELEVYETVGMELAEVIPVQASTNFSIPWKAPLYNFTLGEIEYAAYNLTHLKATVPINFQNHAPFELTGSIQIHMYNSTEILVTEGEATIEALQNAPYQEYIELTVPTAGITENGHLELYFLTTYFNYGPLVLSYD
jgi:hypothetical protein